MVMNLDVSLNKTIVIITNLQIRKSLFIVSSEWVQTGSPVSAGLCGVWAGPAAWPGHMTYPDQSEARTNQATNQKPAMRPLQIYKTKMDGFMTCYLKSPFIYLIDNVSS